MVDCVLIRAASHRQGARDICASHADVDGDEDSGSLLPVVAVGASGSWRQTPAAWLSSNCRVDSRGTHARGHVAHLSRPPEGLSQPNRLRAAFSESGNLPRDRACACHNHTSSTSHLVSHPPAVTRPPRPLLPRAARADRRRSSLQQPLAPLLLASFPCCS